MHAAPVTCAGLPAGASHYGRDTAGWYLQQARTRHIFVARRLLTHEALAWHAPRQLLKLGAAGSAALNVSDRFLLWDADMIALAPLSWTSDDGLRAVRHVGGGRVKTYGAAYGRLTGGERLAAAPDGSSFVTHAMLLDRRHVDDMLRAFARSGAASDGDDDTQLPRWAAAILGALPSKPRNALHLGFSEYASYASWVAAHAPGEVQLAPRRLWTRHPLGSRWAVVAARAAHPAGLCCPTRRALAATAAQGWLYTGWEVGHVAWLCGYDHQRHAAGYGKM